MIIKFQKPKTIKYKTRVDFELKIKKLSTLSNLKRFLKYLKNKHCK